MNALPAITPPLSLTPGMDANSILEGREEEAHRQLEAVFLSMLIKELRTAGLQDGLFPGDSTDTFAGMFDQFMSDELANSGGIGLQQLFQKPVTPAVPDASDTHRQAKEAYKHAASDTTVTAAAGS